MSDVDWLLLLVAGIYCSECARWLRLDAVFFYRRFTRGWLYQFPGGFIRNERGALVVGNVLPPLGPTFVTQWWPISFSPESAFAFVSQAVNANDLPSHSGRLVTLDSIKSVSTFDSEVQIDGRFFAKLCSPLSAAWFAKLIRKLAAAPRESRAELIDQALEKSLNDKRVELIIDHAALRTAELRFLCNVLFNVLVVACGLMVCWTATRWQWPFWLLMVVVLWGWIAVVFRRVFRKLYPCHRKLWRTHGFMMMLSPLAAIRCYDVACRDIVSWFHPLAVARVLCSEELFLRISRETMRDLKFPFQFSDEKQLQEERECLNWFKDRLENGLEGWFERLGVNTTELALPPTAEGEDCISYCPRCHSQYFLTEGTCQPCGGIELVLFESTAQ